MDRLQPFTPGWLARHPVTDPALRQSWARRLATITTPSIEARSPLASAVKELKSGLRALVGVAPVRGPQGACRGLSVELTGIGAAGSFTLSVFPECVRLVAPDGAGVLYGAFRLLEAIALGQDPEGLSVAETPHWPLRMLDHWDNFDGSVERGYAGRSLFFRDGKVLAPGPRLEAYARLCASVGLNAVAINNVNVHGPETRLITPELLPKVAQVAAVFRAWGIKLHLCVNFAAPITLGDLDTADPLDPRVVQWWTERARLVWSAIPDFGGFVVKADSEHRPGPFTYGRDHADGANLLARAVAPFGGRIFWRCFVYNCLQDWRDRTTDRARAAYDHFRPLDGRFLPNVCLQIKNGPMDFQPREPLSPLLGAMPSTHQVLELQSAQEYTGQQRHLCYLPEQWKTYLDFDTRHGNDGRVSRVVDGIVAVSNLGDDPNWTGHDLAQANWFGFARLAWNPDADPRALARTWASLTFGTDPDVVDTVTGLLLGSWKTYEDYTAPLGVGWMVNPNHHYGPNPDGYEYDRWGTYHFADRNGVGVNRTRKNGTGYAGQYHPDNAQVFESVDRCPDEVLLFFHHVAYDHRLKSGKTVVQHIYDTHFDGADRAAAYAKLWKRLEGKVDPDTHQRVADRFAHQADHAALWRDVINTYFWRKSGIPDQSHRPIHP
jgi:alpha-glucuronidase